MESIKLREVLHTDKKAIVENANNWAVAKNMADRFPHPYLESDAEEFIKLCKSDPNAFRLAITYNDEFVGMTGLHFMNDIFKRNAEIGYWIGEEHWGKGIVSAIVPKMVKIGFEKFDNIDRIFGRVFGPNIGSQRVLEKCGFTLEARYENTLVKGEDVLDELIYGIRR